MKRFFFLTIMLFSSLSVFSQKFSITAIEKLPTDMDARVNYPRKDQNGKTCAIIKIATPLTGFSFDTGTLSVQYVVEKTGEIWVYVQPGIRKITIAHQTMGVVREWDIPIKIEEACSYALSINTQTDNTGYSNNSSFGNLSRNVLYKLRKNEILNSGECLLSFKTDGYHFVCLTTDTLIKKDYLIYDGIKKLSKDAIYPVYLDVENPENSIVSYKSDNAHYILIEGEKIGPVYGNNLRYWYGWGDDYIAWNEKKIYGIYNSSLKTTEWYKNGIKLNRKYKSYGYKNFDESKPFRSDTIVSLNGKHKTYSIDMGSVIVNNKTIKLVSENFDNTWRQDLAILDDGRCVVELSRRNFSTRIFVITNGQYKELSDTQYFNYRTGKIENKGSENDGIFIQSWYSLDYDHAKKQNRIIYDKTSTHSLETCGLYDYVTIDNVEYGKESAMGIWYNENMNAFVWTALEANEIVVYTYKL